MKAQRVYRRRKNVKTEPYEWFLQQAPRNSKGVPGTGFQRVKGRFVHQNFVMPHQRLRQNFVSAEGDERKHLIAKLLLLL